MGMPITACLMAAAAKGNEAKYKLLLSRMAYNLEKGHFSVWSCEHKPRCAHPTTEQVLALEERLAQDLAANKPKKSKA